MGLYMKKSVVVRSRPPKTKSAEVRCLILQGEFISDVAREEFRQAATTCGMDSLRAANTSRKQAETKIDQDKMETSNA